MPSTADPLQDALNHVLQHDLVCECLITTGWPLLLQQFVAHALAQGLPGEPAGPLLALALAEALKTFLLFTHGERYTVQKQCELWLPGLLILTAYLQDADALRSPGEVAGRLANQDFLRRSPLGQVATNELLQAVQQEAARMEGGGKPITSTYNRRRTAGIELLAQAIRHALGEQPAGARPYQPLTANISGRPLAPTGTWAGPLLPLDFVERAELHDLSVTLSPAAGSTPPYRAGILSGIAGAGKTTLAAALAQAETVRASFPDGILWVNADQGDVLEELCRQAGLAGRESESWAVRWRRWAGHPTRQALAILDDVVDTALLAPIAGALGQQMTLLVTTQFGDAVEAELRRWLPASAILRRPVEGMTPADAQQLFAGALGRPLAEDESDKIAEAGDLLGWHASALAFAAAQVREYGWDGLLTGLREGGLPSDRLSKLVRQQWERLAAEQRADLSALVRYARGRGPFGLPYALAAWDLKRPEIAEMRLTQLERAGLIERLQAAPDSLYLSPTLWRVAPVVERVLRDAGTPATMARVVRMFERSWLAGRLQGHAGSLLHVPWQFQFLATAWWLVWGTLKLITEALMWLPAQVARTPRLLRWWRMWTLPESTEEHLQARWQRLGLAPSQEVRLLYDAGTLQGIGTAIVMVVGIMTLVLIGLLRLNSVNLPVWVSVAGLLAGLIATGWTLRSVIWRAWLAHLYGVETWDLRLVLRVCHFLGMREQPTSAIVEARDIPKPS